MLKIISSYLAHGEGKECVKCCGNTFFKTQKEKHSFCDKLRCALSLKKAKLLGETGTVR